MTISEGKTKKMISTDTILWVEQKDTLTAGNGARYDILPGKAALVTSITCHLFELLRDHNVPVAYIGRGPRKKDFYTQPCNMIPVEVVVRRIASGSYLKRHETATDGSRFKKLVVEFFHKTTGRQLGGKDLPCDDPLMVAHKDKSWHLYLPDQPKEQAYIGPLEHFLFTKELNRCADIAKKVFEIIEAGWRRLDGELYDLKLEFGFNIHGDLLVADVIDCDSWRVLWHGIPLSKQPYRDGAPLEEVARAYKMAETLVRLMS